MPPARLAESPWMRRTRRDGSSSPFVVLNLIYLALEAFIAWGRYGPESFTA